MTESNVTDERREPPVSVSLGPAILRVSESNQNSEMHPLAGGLLGQGKISIHIREDAAEYRP